MNKFVSPVVEKVRIASSGEQTIGSLFPLNEVFKTPGIPVAL